MTSFLGGALALAFATSVAAGTINIVDGDTIRMDGKTIRIVDLDTPETFRSRCENELVLGLAAKAHLRALIDSGNVTYIETGTDRYGRTLAEVYVDGISIGRQMIADGHALAYQPGRDAKLARLREWCGAHAELTDKWKNTKATKGQGR